MGGWQRIPQVTAWDTKMLHVAEWGQFRTEGDVNCDGAVNVDDLLDLLAAWGPCGL
ncbi:MAG: hypothetical protein O7G85_07300 [Planctomycetota bacterium]|nr:hypothetical protein [Planctomycetota bacterium]